MFSQEEEDIKQICTVCESNTFFKQDGFYYCSQCHTKIINIREQVLDQYYDPNVRATKITIKKKAAEDNTSGWTTWELYNYALIGIVEELISLGADPAIKLTALQLWVKYLQRLEVAFTSTTTRIVPRLSRKYSQKYSFTVDK